MSRFRITANGNRETIVDTYGRVIAVIEERRLTTSEYDAQGNLASTTAYAQPIDEANLNELLEGRFPIVDPQRDIQTSLTYDAFGRVIATTQTGVATEIHYDHAGNDAEHEAIITPQSLRLSR